MVEIDIDPDTYNEIEFDVHCPSGTGSEDQAFLLEHPEFEDRDEDGDDLDEN